MSALFDELEKQARTLPANEKATLARILIEQLDPSLDAEVEQLWVAEAQRRYEAFRKGELEALHLGREVDRDLRRMLLHRFPFSLVYSVEVDAILIVAVAHYGRRPGYWQSRVDR
jgi:hypothetical protein